MIQRAKSQSLAAAGGRQQQQQSQQPQQQQQQLQQLANLNKTSNRSSRVAERANSVLDRSSPRDIDPKSPTTPSSNPIWSSTPNQPKPRNIFFANQVNEPPSSATVNTFKGASLFAIANGVPANTTNDASTKPIVPSKDNKLLNNDVVWRRSQSIG